MGLVPPRFFFALNLKSSKSCCMKKDKNPIASLRRQAEANQKKRTSNENSFDSEADCLKLIHELEVHLFELELQNQELVQATTDARLMTAKYRNLYDFAATGYFTLSKDGKISDMNFCGANMLGKERSYYKNKFLIVFVSNETKTIFNHFLENISDSNSNENCDNVFSSDDNAQLYVHLTEIKIKDNGHFLITAVDISKLKLSEDELKKTLTKLECSNKELEQFAYVASHDLQEPLRMVTSYTQLLADRYKDKLDDDAREFIAYAVDGAKRMEILINDLLKFSRLSTRQNPHSLTNCNKILDQVKTTLSLMIEEKNALITGDILPSVMGDEMQLLQLMQNLISNGIKYNDSKQPSVHVSVKDENNEWVFKVKDNGIGIDKEFYERIFVMFQRLHTMREYKGSGIGLAIYKRIVECHGGRIWVVSEKGKGSEFYFSIAK